MASGSISKRESSIIIVSRITSPPHICHNCHKNSIGDAEIRIDKSFLLSEKSGRRACEDITGKKTSNTSDFNFRIQVNFSENKILAILKCWLPVAFASSEMMPVESKVTMANKFTCWSIYTCGTYYNYNE